MIPGAVTDEFSPDLDVAAPAMRAAGLESAELRVLWGRNILDISDADLDRALALLERNQLPVRAIASPLLKCALPDAPPVDTRFQQDVFASRHTFEDQPRLSERAIQIARRAGAPIVRVFSFWRVTEPAEIFERVVWALRDLATEAAKHHITIALENEHACNVSTARDCARMLAAIDHSNLQLVWDPANAVVAGEPPDPEEDFLMLPASRIAHVHAKDCRMVGGKPQWLALGDGDVNWPDQMAALARCGYSGALHLETHWPGPNGDKLEASNICAERLRKLIAAV